MSRWMGVVAAIALLAAACDKDDGTSGWTMASSGGDSTSSAGDTSGTTDDTGGGATAADTGGTATTDGDAAGTATTDGAAADGAVQDAQGTDGQTTAGTDTAADGGAGDTTAGATDPPVFSLVDLNPASDSFAQTLGSGKLSGRLVLLVFHHAADSDSRARAVALEQVRVSYETLGGSQPAIIAINELGAGSSIQDYVVQGSTTIHFPVLQDTDEDVVWLAFGAERQDMLLLDLQDGLPGAIVARWNMATGQLDPTNADQLGLLYQALASHLK